MRPRSTGSGRCLESPYQQYLRGIKPRDTHRGYFPIDKHGRAVNSAVKRGNEFSDYDLILKNKERLLSFDEPTRFIFSHSALREGWNNPNVFQICTLKHPDNATARRQEAGRGLRLCVNQSGDRQDLDALGEDVQDVNTLTVIASESYAKFVSDLQNKIRLDGTPRTISEREEREAKVIHNYLLKNDYIDLDDHVTPEYRAAQRRRYLAALNLSGSICSAGTRRSSSARSATRSTNKNRL
ncbi:hypothetical protein AGMMS49925_05120 [Deltaproteobacteria bacterium]|nr:hypothetical protein AGMMS49925_05120 [Deltaproteobacteria bacterium]